MDVESTKKMNEHEVAAMKKQLLNNLEVYYLKVVHLKEFIFLFGTMSFDNE